MYNVRKCIQLNSIKKTNNVSSAASFFLLDLQNLELYVKKAQITISDKT